MKIFLIVFIVVFVGAIVLAFALHEDDAESSIVDDINYLYDHGHYDELNEKYGNLIKDAIVEFSKREDCFYHENTAKSELTNFDTEKKIMILGQWLIDINDLSVELDVVPNLGPGESGCEFYIKGKLEYIAGRFEVTKTDEYQAMIEID